MLFYAVLAAALPLALALACPCPPAPADSAVCGSDLVTYDSQCHLQCAAEPDVSLKHAGPCSATEEKERWDVCYKERQCSDLDAPHCGCGEDDYGCKFMCLKNCDCRCGGYPQGGMDIGVWIECTDRMRCRKTHDQCNGACGGEEECEASCSLDNDKCACECMQEASAPQRKRNWTTCLEQHQCHSTTCSECIGDDPSCPERCKKRCRCECAGWAWRDLSGEWEKCFIGTQTCEQAHSACVRECGDQDDCKDKCYMDLLDCSCECRTTKEEEWRLWDECKRKEACHSRTCSECIGDDPSCPERCKRCRCECAGWTRRDLSGGWDECFIGTRTCEQAHSACVRECGDQDDCKDKCYMARLDCECECRTAEEEEWRLWDECMENSECSEETCKECQDTDCEERCRRNCGCRCLGINADSLEDDPLQECKLESRCDANRKNCRARCKTAKGKDCELSCNLAFEKCYCECARSRPPKRVEIIQHCNFIN